MLECYNCKRRFVDGDINPDEGMCYPCSFRCEECGCFRKGAMSAGLCDKCESETAGSDTDENGSSRPHTSQPPPQTANRQPYSNQSTATDKMTTTGIRRKRILPYIKFPTNEDETEFLHITKALVVATLTAYLPKDIVEAWANEFWSYLFAEYIGDGSVMPGKCTPAEWIKREYAFWSSSDSDEEQDSDAEDCEAFNLRGELCVKCEPRYGVSRPDFVCLGCAPDE
jgi:hypothetical protein